MTPPSAGPERAAPPAGARPATPGSTRAGSSRPGLLGRLRRLLGTTLELVQLRVELLATDVQLGTLRLFDAIVLALAALLLLAAGVGVLATWVVLMLAPEYRLPAMGVVAVALLAGGAWALARARARLRAAGGAFVATRAELARDLAALGPDGDRPT